jgi:hypothetical protein
VVDRFRCRYILYIVTAKLQTANVTYFQKGILLPRFSAHPDGSPSQLIQVSEIVLNYDNDVNMLGESVYTVKENAEALVVAIKEMGLEVNAYKTKYMFISRDRNAGRSHSMKTDSSSFERV